MSETETGGRIPKTLLRRVREVRAGLLRLHKALLDAERDAYVRAHGEVTRLLSADWHSYT